MTYDRKEQVFTKLLSELDRPWFSVTERLEILRLLVELVR